MVLTGQAGEGEHPRLLCNMVPGARGAQSFQTFSEALSRSLQAPHHYLNNFTPEEKHGKYLVRQYQISKDIGWVSQNTTLYGVRCHPVTPYTVIKCCVLTHPPDIL